MQRQIFTTVQTLGWQLRRTGPSAKLRFALCAVCGLSMWPAGLAAEDITRGEATARQLEHQRIALYEAWANPVAPSPSSEPQRARPYFDPSRQYFYIPPSGDTDDRPVEETDRRQAEALFALAQSARDAKQGQLAFRLAHEVLQFDPQHAEARRWLGMTNSTGQDFRRINVRPGRRAHPGYGWPAGTYRHVTSPHFQVATNDDEATAIELVRTLEELFGVWEQMFFDCWRGADISGTQTEVLTTGNRRRARHQVVMFADRTEYIQYVAKLEPQAELTRGYYHAPSRIAFFVGGDDPRAATWRHEATHQLFHERLPSTQHVGQAGNVWIIEGIALYMESLQRCRQWFTVGGLEAERLQFARFRALREGFYLPLESLVQLQQRSLQQDERIRQLYSQAAGLTHFLLDGQQGRHRSALIQYLRQVYQSRDRLESLAQLTGSSFGDLDRQYHEFLKVSDAQLQEIDPGATIRQLCLGGTSVSDQGLLSLPTLEQVTWLDLYGLPITDQGAESLANAHQLVQLNLEQTLVSDVTIARLQGAKRLKQLDLSGTRITDAALTSLASLSQLEALWLTGTRITDSALQQLSALTNLQTLDLSETPTTQEGRATLRRSLPGLQAE